jgi:hypothetical protein
MDDLAAKEISRPRTALAVAGVFALMAIVLAAVGVYGVMSYEVSQRRRELAVRSALGASPDQIFRVVVGRSAIVGAAVGIGNAGCAACDCRARGVCPGAPRRQGGPRGGAQSRISVPGSCRLSYLVVGAATGTIVP